MPIFSVYAMFKDDAAARAWEGKLPAERLGTLADGAEIEVMPSSVIRDTEGGFYEGSFLKVLCRDEAFLTSLIAQAPKQFCDARREGFTWKAGDALCKGSPEDWASAYEPPKYEEVEVGVIGDLGGGSSMG